PIRPPAPVIRTSGLACDAMTRQRYGVVLVSSAGGSSVSLLIYSPLHSPTVLGDTATSADQIVSTFSVLPRNRSSRARDANVVLMCCRCYYTGPACCRHRLLLQPTQGVTKTTQLLRSSTTWLPTEFLMSV